MSNSTSLENVYKTRKSFVIIGLTGRTGSGCSTVAKILNSEFGSIALKDAKRSDYQNEEEQKYSIIYDYISNNERWVPFTIIEMSSIILAMSLEKGWQPLLDYLDKMQEEKDNTVLNISDYNNLKTVLSSNYQDVFSDAKKYDLSSIDMTDIKQIDEYYEYYTRTLLKYKGIIKDVFANYQCSEILKPKLGGRKQTKLHLYTYLLQQMGNNIRASGDPYITDFSENKSFVFLDHIRNLIEVIRTHNNNHGIDRTRICIDAIRNPFEALFFRDNYRAFYLLSVNAEDADRIGRLSHLSKEEREKLDEIEYPERLKSPQEIYYHQNIQGCLEIADIHVHNPNVHDDKYYGLSELLVKFVSLIIHPGLITPTDVERCMQLAFNAKYNSGCLSRQVGAVVTRNDYSVISVGWNDVPEGQTPCNLRDVATFCKNKDSNSHSEYEITNVDFYNIMSCLCTEVKEIYDSGRHFPYCFKDIHNGMNNSDNQVFTRSLHAEENAFLQVAKFGGMGVKGGNLFTTASPCELCAKKAYQLGIKKIYYIDPYPGISRKHILSFGDGENPTMCLFSGAVGNAYLSLYAPRMPIKDELELVTGVNPKSFVNKELKNKTTAVGVDDINYHSVESILIFESRERIKCIRKIDGVVLKGSFASLDKYVTWTGTSYDGSVLLSPSNYEIIDSKETVSPYKYTIIFDEEKINGSVINYTLETKVHDEKHFMNPYFSYSVTNRTKRLDIRVIAPKGILKEVKGVLYADLIMDTIFDDIHYRTVNNDGNDEYIIQIENPNLFYTYSLEWKFE